MLVVVEDPAVTVTDEGVAVKAKPGSGVTHRPNRVVPVRLPLEPVSVR